MINKRRKIINGVEIVLLEKSPTQQVGDTPSLYSSIESKLRSYIDTQIDKKIPESNIQYSNQESQPVTQSQVETLLPIYNLTTDDLLSLVSNSPEEGSVLTYDGDGVNLTWKQSPNVRLDLLENVISNYPIEFSSDKIYSNKFHLPFAVTAYTDGTPWGGNGKAGIFWNDPWNKPIDNYSIKMGRDDASIGETGYTYGRVKGLAMKFSNDSAGEDYGEDQRRGFVWNVNGRGPVMSLDTGMPKGMFGGDGGNLTVKNQIISELGFIQIGGNDSITPLVGNIYVSNFTPTNPIIATSGGSDTYNDYVLTYETYAGSLGHIKLKPPTGGGGGGGTFPGVQIDGGSFLQTDQYCRIDAGSFI